MEAHELENLSPEELIELSENDTTGYRRNRWSLYKLAHDKYEQKNQQNDMEDMARETRAFQLSTRNSSQQRFSPMFSGITEEGSEWKYPDIDNDFPDEAIAYYAQRANSTINPILKARYCDLIWEVKKEISFARMAIEAYVDSCTIYIGNEWDSELADSLDRSATIACMINDQKILELSLNKHFEVIDQLSKAKRVRWLPNIINSILDRNNRTNKSIDYEYLLSTLEFGIEECAKNIKDSFHEQRSFMKTILKIHGIQNNDDGVISTRVRIADSLIEEAEWKRVNYPSGNMVAAIFYTKAMQEYINIGGYPDKVDDLKRRIMEINKDAKKEFGVITTEVEISEEPFKKHLEIYENRDTMEIYELMNQDPGLIPSWEQAEKLAEEI